ncbi:unnamed protein product [Caenorhabditis sp. 36 PRJEB53466]|nr:unnamed protein product [Caenorhabditis sp. 36 PRJEB53466]
MSGTAQNHWKHTWPCASVFGDFLCSNREKIRDGTVLEIGAGATGVCGLTVAKLGAKRVWMTDHPNLNTALQTLQRNVEANGVSDRCVVTGLDWEKRDSVARVIDLIGDRLDFVIASDVFFDPSTFRGLVDTFAQLLRKFEHATVWIAYQQRDDNWTCAPQLANHPFIQASLTRRIETERETIDIFTMTAREESRELYAGIEVWSSSQGTNFYLTDYKIICKKIADWILEVFEKEDLDIRNLKALGLGLSGAEDEEFNQQFVEHFRKNHGDITDSFYLTSDSVMTLLANFPGEENGIVLIAGTGSSCRMKKRDGTIKGVGGWGHQIGDGGSAFWIARSAIQMLFDAEDGLETEFNTDVIKRLLLEHYNIDDKTRILDYLYSNFEKHKIADFTATLAKKTNDPAIAEVFRRAGNILGKHVATVARNLSEEDRKTLHVVQIGGVFQSWPALHKGFVEATTGNGIQKIEMYEPCDSPAVGSAALAAKEKNGTLLPQQAERKKLLEIQLGY